MLRITRALPVVIALAGLARADTIRVDDDGGAGVDFTDLPAALDMASAGDLILVEPGSYTGTGIFSGVTVLGTGPGVNVSSGLLVQWIPANEVCVLADLVVKDLEILFCDGTVVVDTVTWDTGFPQSVKPDYLRVNDSVDVRLQRCSIEGPVASGHTASRILHSRVELLSSSLVGGRGANSDCGAAQSGFPAISVFQDSRLVLVGTNATGGAGGSQTATCISFCGGLGGDGAPAIEAGFGPVETGTELFLAGRSTDLLKGGIAGLGEVCDCDGSNAVGVRIARGTLRHSGITIEGADDLTGCLGSGPADLDVGPEATETAAADDPFLEHVGTPALGQSTTFVVDGPPGAKYKILLGVTPTVDASAGVRSEVLIGEERLLFSGVIPAGGQSPHAFTWPSHPVYRGQTFYVQAVVRTGPGQEARTNSVPLVIR